MVTPGKSESHGDQESGPGISVYSSIKLLHDGCLGNRRARLTWKTNAQDACDVCSDSFLRGTWVRASEVVPQWAPVGEVLTLIAGWANLSSSSSRYFFRCRLPYWTDHLDLINVSFTAKIRYSFHPISVWYVAFNTNIKEVAEYFSWVI